MGVADHKSYYNGNKEIPSVTGVLKLLNKPELVEWANWMGRRGLNTTEFVIDSAENGTYAHYYIERICKKKILNYGLIKNFNKSKQKKILTAIKSFKSWKKNNKPKFIHNELRIQNNKVGGTIDCVCDIDGKKYIVDFKTSKKAYPIYFIQLAAYNYLYRTEKNGKIDYAGILVLDKRKTRYDFVCMDITYLEKYYEPVFVLMLELYYKWNENLKNDWNTSLD